jgi:hypothetical protein
MRERLNRLAQRNISPGWAQKPDSMEAMPSSRVSLFFGIG